MTARNEPASGETDSDAAPRRSRYARGSSMGPSIGGWFTGLSLTSGPVSVFLAIERGPDFARGPAEATVLGLAGVAAFCFTYHRAMSTLSAPTTLSLGVGGTS